MFFLAVSVFLCIPLLAKAEILLRDTKHNLSVSGPTGPGAVRASQETQICIFCHAPHNATPAHPLWNHDPSAVQTYKTYWSNTLQAYTEAQSLAWPVDGYSKLCLDCHDGTVAVGAVSSRNDAILMSGSSCIDASGKLIPGGSDCTGYVGTDLSGGHPISFVFDGTLVAKRNNPDLGLSHIKLPADPNVKLYPTHGCTGRCGVQCTSCHDPHTNRTTDKQNGKPWPPFWQKAHFDDVCLACHEDIPPGNIQW